MHRRDLLRVLGTAAALPVLGALSVEELLATGSALHARRSPHPLRFDALSPHEGATVTAIAEMIIPETDTPGATAAGVPAFLDLLVAEWFLPDEAAAFRAGLEEVDARARALHGVDFVDADEAGRAAVLRAMEAEAGGRGPAAGSPPPFFSTIKYLTLWGYYTSEVGATEELGYETIPGRFDGCVPVPAAEGRAP